MSSLWTPEGEHRVPRPGEESPPPGGRPVSGGGGPEGSAPPRPVGGAEGGAAAEPTDEEIRQLARELAQAPVEDVVANHCYGLFELAALHLSQQPANLQAARLAIDAMGHLVDGLGERLGSHAASLAEGLAQIRLAYVRIADTAASPAGNGHEPGTQGGGAAPEGPPEGETS